MKHKIPKYAICDDCKEPIKNIFEIYDYIDLDLKQHTVCKKCIMKVTKAERELYKEK